MLLEIYARINPALTLVDGIVGMEGEGPVYGTEVKTKVAIASLDPLAADRIALEIMRIDPKNVGYLVYCEKEGLGEYNLSKIEILGNKLNDCIYHRRFKLHSTIKEQLGWKE